MQEYEVVEAEVPDRKHGQYVLGRLISERCKHLVREVLGSNEEHVSTSAVVDHAADAFRYAVIGVG